jgi:hypothetical protein
MWPVDLSSEVAIRRQRLLNGGLGPRRGIRGGWRLRTRLGAFLVRLGLVVAGAPIASPERPIHAAPCP